MVHFINKLRRIKHEIVIYFDIFDRLIKHVFALLVKITEQKHRMSIYFDHHPRFCSYTLPYMYHKLYFE